MTTASFGKYGWLVKRPIAHRGLHDGNRAVPENSLAAAKAAIAEGFAIECDVQLSAEGTPHIFHDAVLGRMTGRDAAFADLSDAEIAGLRLVGTDEPIPTVAAFFDVVGGRVPIVMELKGDGANRDGAYVERLRPLVSAYAGELALMSFDGWLIDQLVAARLEGRPIGLTAEGTEADTLAAHRQVFERGCDFVSYNVHHLPNAFVSWVRGTCKAPVITWTARSPEDEAISRREADQITFEGFAPQQ
ncbi:glycerophosphodiester phosphodiesterase family protein [Jiella sp. M17.18]|uniref:glycerophosphodiester phosphodiesterase family protein n=1 Tax=Jiella sp. M17.18 TaxID=3234247 RepID=UPI0034DEC4A8